MKHIGCRVALGARYNQVRLETWTLAVKGTIVLFEQFFQILNLDGTVLVKLIKHDQLVLFGELVTGVFDKVEKLFFSRQ
jgi:hypothetical protein